MMTFNVNVNVTGLEGLTSVIAKLVSVTPVNPANVAVMPEPAKPHIVTAAPLSQVPLQSPSTQVPSTQGYAPQAPQMQLATAVTLASPAPQPQYVAQQQPVSPVPIVAQTYSMEQIAVAATQLMDAGRRTEIVSLLGAFGVQALTALPKEQYGAFATQLRAMGAQV